MRKEYNLDSLQLKRRGLLPGLKASAEKPPKVRITIALDQDLVEHFRREAAEPGALPYQTRINQELRRVLEPGGGVGVAKASELKAALLADEDFLRQVSKRVAARRRE